MGWISADTSALGFRPPPPFWRHYLQAVYGFQPLVFLAQLVDDPSVVACNTIAQEFYIFAAESVMFNRFARQFEGRVFQNRPTAQVSQQMRIFRYENFYRQLLAARSAETLLPVERVLHQFPFGKLRGPLLAKKIGIEINPERIDAAVEVFVIVVKLRN